VEKAHELKPAERTIVGRTGHELGRLGQFV
jgi:hypothetical protein